MTSNYTARNEPRDEGRHYPSMADCLRAMKEASLAVQQRRHEETAPEPEPTTFDRFTALLDREMAEKRAENDKALQQARYALARAGHPLAGHI